MKKTDLAYVAGIVDGEGTIGLYYTSKNSIALIVTVANTNEWLIQWLKLAFGGKTCLINDGRELKRNKPLYRWYLNFTDALEFLELVYPYLRLKKPQAEIAIKFLKMRGQKGRRLTSEERLIGEAQRIVMSKLNKKGI